MRNALNLVVDTMWEQYDLMKDHATHEFWDFGLHKPIPDSIYVVGRKQVIDNLEKFRHMIDDDRLVMIFANSAEGSSTLHGQLRRLGLLESARGKKLLVISGGDMDPDIPYLIHEHFLIRILDYAENKDAMTQGQSIFTKTDKPYKFLFLNGRMRPHRKYLWERLRDLDLLDSSIWTVLDCNMAGSRYFSLRDKGIERMDTETPLRRLDSDYEVDRYRQNQVDLSGVNRYIKHDIFGSEWGEVYINSKPYIDSYFSVVTETALEQPYSFRTEKIAKVLCVGHPWICATNRGFYRDLKNLGFRTFGHLIDESFDMIDNHQDRMDRVIERVFDLCQQDLGAFLTACQDVCKYNQDHLCEIVPRFRQDFPQQFWSFVQRYKS